MISWLPYSCCFTSFLVLNQLVQVSGVCNETLSLLKSKWALHKELWLCRWLFGQLTHYAHCMFLHRHVYRYIVFWDTDEFLILNGSVTLQQILEEMFAKHPLQAAASLIRYAYRSECNHPFDGHVNNVSAWLAQFDMREPETETHRGVHERNWSHLANKGDKLVVRPLLVDEFYHHFLISARPGYIADSFASPLHQAFLKHLRRYHGKDDCKMLTSSNPMFLDHVT